MARACWLQVAVAAGLLAAATALAPVAAQSPSSAPPLAEVLARVRFVAYTAREFSVEQGVVRPATAAGIRRDLTMLRPRFDGLVTYSVTGGHEEVVAAAGALGFRAVVLGVWDPASDAELDTAERLAREAPALVVAIAVGNEGLFWGRYDWPTLRRGLDRVRERLATVAVTTSEPFAVYLDGRYPGLVEAQDFLLPNVHPTFEPWFRPDAVEQGADFVGRVVDALRARFGKPVLVKETGLPAGPADSGFTEERQAAFWGRLRERLRPDAERSFAYFEAFDAPWKPAAQALDSKVLAPEEGYWGLFDREGRPRRAALDLTPLPPGE